MPRLRELRAGGVLWTEGEREGIVGVGSVGIRVATFDHFLSLF
jgi:hypothetical protein